MPRRRNKWWRGGQPLVPRKKPIIPRMKPIVPRQKPIIPRRTPTNPIFKTEAQRRRASFNDVDRRKLRNTQRQANRLIDRLERDAREQTGTRREQTENRIAELRDMLQSTKLPRRVNMATQPHGEDMKWAIESNRKELQAYIKDIRSELPDKGNTNRASQQRANNLFQRQLNLASNGQVNTLPDRGLTGSDLLRYQQLEASIFYASTRMIWRGQDPTKRNELIMDYLGTDSLEDAFDTVMQANQDALERAYFKNWSEFDPSRENELLTEWYEDVTTVWDTEEQAAFAEELGYDDGQYDSPLSHYGISPYVYVY